MPIIQLFYIHMFTICLYAFRCKINRQQCQIKIQFFGNAEKLYDDMAILYDLIFCFFCFFDFFCIFAPPIGYRRILILKLKEECQLKLD